MSGGPLKGVRVLEFEGLGPAPFCAMLLAGMGAEVLRVGRPGARGLRAEVGETVVLRGRPAVGADLKKDGDREAVLRLAGAADVLLEGFRPGVMERLGLGPEVCWGVNPRLVYGRMTGWGQIGPLAARAGHDINYIALTGALGAIGEAGRPPVAPLNLVGDYGGGAMFLAVGVLAGVLEARAGGRGQVVDAAMTDGSAVLMSLFHSMAAGGAWSAERGDNLLDGGAPFYRCYECADGGYMAVGALEPQFFAALVRVAEIDFPVEDQLMRRRWGELGEMLAAVFLTRSRDEWTAVFENEDACVTPVLTFLEAPGHAHNLARETYKMAGGIAQPAPAPRFSRSGEVFVDAAPEALCLAEALKRWGLTG